jgi:hypothetical protein
MPAPLPAQSRIYALKAARIFDSSTGKLAQPGVAIVENGSGSISAAKWWRSTRTNSRRSPI